LDILFLIAFCFGYLVCDLLWFGYLAFAWLMLWFGYLDFALDI